MMPLMRLAAGALIEVHFSISNCCKGADVDFTRWRAALSGLLTWCKLVSTVQPSKALDRK